MKMTKIFATALPLCAAALLAGCNDAPIEENIAPAAAGCTISATIENEADDTRAYVDGQNFLVTWQKGDKISFFPTGANDRHEAILDDKYDGKSYGKFDCNLSITENPDARHYGVFPHSADNSLEEASQTINTVLPAAQTYRANSFGGLNVYMTAHAPATANYTLNFQSYHSALGLRLKGDAEVAKIRITSDVENLAGMVTVATPYTDYPVAVAANDVKSVTLDCGSAQLTAEAQPFCVALLPGTYTKLTVEILDAAGNVLVKKTASNQTFNRAKIKMMKGEIELNKPEEPNNPGSTDSWGGDDTDIEYTTSSLKKVATANGWTTNSNIYGNGGFATMITYLHNGIMNNLLTSKDGTTYFFQWGRWLGFPTTCIRTKFSSGGSASGYYPIDSQSLAGVNLYDTRFGYIFNTGIGAAYGACYMGNSSWTRTRTLNSSIIFGMVSSLNSHGDYIGANENCSWSDRCGNPCPDGYRIPTAEELEVLIPSTGEVNGSYAEVKTVKGTKYAMQWKVNTSGSLPYVEICSVKTSADKVSVGDPIFSSAKVIRLPAYGYMDNEGDLQRKGTIGVYWSCDSGTNTISGTTGNGGKYLEIDFEGNSAIMGIGVALRSFGAPVMPIKDDTAKATALTPWLPVWQM